MKRKALLLTAVMLAATLLVGGTAAAEPHKNQVRVQASCDNGKNYTFVLNAQGNSGKIVGSKSNIIIKSYVATYTNVDTGQTFVDTYDSGNKYGQQRDLISCTGETTYVDNVFGEVNVVFQFEGFVTPRTNA